MVDLNLIGILPNFNSDITNYNDGEIGFENSLRDIIKSNQSDSKKADSLAKIIHEQTNDIRDEEKKLAQIERSLAYIRAKGGSELSSKVYENINESRDEHYIDIFGKSNDMPSAVKNSTGAKTEWNKIMSGAAYDYITENEQSIKDSLKKADKETKDWVTTYTIDDNEALSKLKNQLIENGMNKEDADKHISSMLREKNLLKEGERVKINSESTEALSETEKEKGLEKLRSELKEKIKGADSPEEVQEILEASVDDLERYRPKSEVDEPEKFYTEEMQKILNDTEYKDYHVAATPSLEKNKNGDIKVSIDGKVSDSVFVNSDGEFVGKDGKELEERTKNGTEQVKVGDKWIDKEDIKPSEPKINVYMNKDKEKVEDKAIEEEREYLKDSKNVHKARGDEKAVKELEEAEGILDDTEEALKKKRESGEKENGKDNTLAIIMAVISAVGTIVAALSQGSGKTVTVSDSGGYSRGGNGGYGYGSYANDKYGYNRGYETTVAKAYERSNQYLSTIYDNPVRTRASIMRKNGMAAIQGQNGYTSPIYQ